MRNKIFNSGVVIAAILFSLFVSTVDANAQNTKRKKTKKAKVVAAPPTVADNNQPYLDGNQIVLGETPIIPEPSTEPLSELPPPTTENINTETSPSVAELNARIKSLEAGNKNDYDQKQKRLALNLDILTKAEQRAESLRKQLFEIIEKEATVRTRLEQISYDARPEMIERSTAFSGSLRPEEIREQRKKSLEAEKRNLELLMTQIQTNRASLEENVQKADFLVEKVRIKLDKDIDAALADDKEDQ